MPLDKKRFHKILDVFPTLERDERLDLVQQFEQNAQIIIDFIMMMLLSTSLASLGLLADSTAVVIGAMLVAPLMLHMIEGRRMGQNRPLEYPVSIQVRQAVNQHLSYWPTVDLIGMGRNSVEPEAGTTIILMSAKNLPPEFEESLTKVVHEARGDETVVRIFPLLEAREQAPEPQSINE